MNKHNINAILAVTSLTFSAAAMALTLSEHEYHSIKKSIAVDYRSDLENCASYASNEKKLCMSVAKSSSKLALAELDARYRPADQAEYKVSMDKAASDYKLSQQNCISQTQELKVLCLNTAQATRNHAEALAHIQLTAHDQNEHSQDDPNFVRDPDSHQPFPVTQHGYL